MWLATVSSKVQRDPWALPEWLRQVRPESGETWVQSEPLRTRGPREKRARQGGRETLDNEGRLGVRDQPVSWELSSEWLPRVRLVSPEERCRQEPQDRRERQGPQAERARKDPRPQPELQDRRGAQARLARRGTRGAQEGEASPVRRKPREPREPRDPPA